MKKFSEKINNKDSKKSQNDYTKKDKEPNEYLKTKLEILKLMDDFLSIRTYGPIDRYQRAGLIKIAGKEIFVDALLNYLNKKLIKSNISALEQLKYQIKDWKTIDKKIEELNNNLEELLKNEKRIFKYKNQIKNLFDKYNQDENLLLDILEEKLEKTKNPNTILLKLKATENLMRNEYYNNKVFKKIYEKLQEKYMKKLKNNDGIK